MSEICHFEDFELDPLAYRLSRTGETVRLERIPMELLCLLVERRGQVVTRAEILEHVWGKGVFIDSENAINTAIRKIRRALEDDAESPHFIVTIPGKGYRFIAPVLVPNGNPDPVAGRNGEVKPVAALNGELTEKQDGHEPFPARLADIPAPLRVRENAPRSYWLAGLLAGVALAAGVMLAVFLDRAHLRSPSGNSVQSPPAPLAEKPSIAVLPFINMSGDREQEYFSDGITDDLITGLSRLPELLVIARASTFTYKGKAAKVQDVGRELGVKYVLEGSVRKAGNRVRVAVHLADTTNGAQLWAEHYDRPITDVFTLQDEIVRRIVTTLNLQIALSEEGVMIPRSTDNLEAYDDVLRGTEYLLSFSREGNAKARLMLEKALELDPGYAIAYSNLGVNYYVGWVFSYDRNPDALERSLRLGLHAAALDDSLAPAHSLLAQVYIARQQYEQALSEVQRCIVLDPNADNCYAVLGHVLAIQGSPSEAVATIEKARRLNPHRFDYMWVEGWAYTFLGQWDKAIGVLKVFLNRTPDSPWPHAWLAMDYYGLGDLDAAHAEAMRAERANELSPTADGYAAVAVAYNGEGNLAEGLAVAEKGIQLYPGKRGIFYQLVSAYTALGRWEESARALKNYLALFPGDIYAHTFLARDYSAMGDLDAARAEAAEVERGLRLDPNFASEPPRSYDTLAEVMNDTGRPAEALGAAEKSNRPDRVRLAYLYEKGRAYTQLGRWQQAISSLKAYSAVHPRDVWPHVDLAVDYVELGQQSAARAEVAEILRLNPRFSLEMGIAGEFPTQKERAADLIKAGLK